MLPNAPAPSTSISPSNSRPSGGAALFSAMLASWQAKVRERMHERGLAGYLAIWMLRPIFEISLAGLIYGSGHHDLVRYSVVALAANAFVFNTIFYIGEILDGERIRGTLLGLFLAPCSRFAWLSGFTLVGVVETVLVAAVALAFGHFAFHVPFDPNYPALALSLVLFFASLWGLGFVFSAVGVLLKKANQLSNVIFPIATLLGGIYYPVARLPIWLRVPARALPLGYGTQALASATLDHASIRTLAPQLLPLAAFALVLPVAGVLAFNWLERLVREQGELDLY